MTENRCFFIDGPSKIKIFYDIRGFNRKMFMHQFCNLLFRYRIRIKTLDQHTDRFCNTYGIGELHLTLFGKTCRDVIFCDIACGISTAPINLCRGDLGIWDVRDILTFGRRIFPALLSRKTTTHGSRRTIQAGNRHIFTLANPGRTRRVVLEAKKDMIW